MKNKILEQIKIVLVISVVIFSLSGCGGGGGGGSDQGSGRSAATGVRILHGAIEGAPVDLYSSSQEGSPIGNARFGEESFYLALPTGESLITLTTRFNANALIYSGALNFEKNQHASLLLYGDQTNFGLSVSLLNDKPSEIPNGMYGVRVVDSLIGASSVVATVGAENISGAKFGGASEYVFQEAAINDYIIKRSFDNLVVDRGSFTFEAGKAYTLFISGEIDYLVVTRVLED